MWLRHWLHEMKVQIGEVLLKINKVKVENKAAIVVDKFATTIFHVSGYWIGPCCYAQVKL
jgi:hypothetical protein